jgi:hypothetical protein
LLQILRIDDTSRVSAGWTTTAASHPSAGPVVFRPSAHVRIGDHIAVADHRGELGQEIGGQSPQEGGRVSCVARTTVHSRATWVAGTDADGTMRAYATATILMATVVTTQQIHTNDSWAVLQALIARDRSDLVGAFEALRFLLRHGTDNDLYYYDEPVGLFKASGQPNMLVPLQGAGGTKSMHDGHPRFRARVAVLREYLAHHIRSGRVPEV